VTWRATTDFAIRALLGQSARGLADGLVCPGIGAGGRLGVVIPCPVFVGTALIAAFSLCVLAGRPSHDLHWLASILSAFRRTPSA